MKNYAQEDRGGEEVPLTGSWKGWYLLVVVFLILEIIFFSFFTQYFS